METLEAAHDRVLPPRDRLRARPLRRRPRRGQARGGRRPAQPLAPAARCPRTLRDEITPKNILMIGPTGVGKTEIARRLARLAQAPFLKVEATKFTEVGYVGRDVDQIMRDLVEIAIGMVREQPPRRGAAPRPRRPPRSGILDALVGAGRRPGHPRQLPQEAARRRAGRQGGRARPWPTPPRRCRASTSPASRAPRWACSTSPT